jgi:hypothetical protein
MRWLLDHGDIAQIDPPAKVRRGPHIPPGFHIVVTAVLERRPAVVRGASRSPSFLSKLFQICVVPMPSFSKECLGGFGDFKGLQAIQIRLSVSESSKLFTVREARQQF